MNYLSESCLYTAVVRMGVPQVEFHFFFLSVFAFLTFCELEWHFYDIRTVKTVS